MLLNEYINIDKIKNRPGLELEKEYYHFLLKCVNDGYRHGIFEFKWDSIIEKSCYDFAVDCSYDGRIFIDVVGHYRTASGSIRLHTKHKDFNAQLEELSDPEQCGFSDCFKLYEAFKIDGEWLYLPVHKHLPRGDVTLDKRRYKTVRHNNTVFDR